MPNIEISERIKAVIRKQGGYDAVSKITNINRQALIRIATGKSEPKFNQMISISETCDISLEELAHGSNSKYRNTSGGVDERVSTLEKELETLKEAIQILMHQKSA